MRQLSQEGKSVADIAAMMKRQPGAIASRLAKLGLGSHVGGGAGMKKLALFMCTLLTRDFREEL